MTKSYSSHFVHEEAEAQISSSPELDYIRCHLDQGNGTARAWTGLEGLRCGEEGRSATIVILNGLGQYSL